MIGNRNIFSIFKTNTVFIPFIATGCRDNSNCPPKQACINKLCQNPCVANNPCNPNDNCRIEGQSAICITGKTLFLRQNFFNNQIPSTWLTNI